MSFVSAAGARSETRRQALESVRDAPVRTVPQMKSLRVLTDSPLEPSRAMSRAIATREQRRGDVHQLLDPKRPAEHNEWR